jgi:hypothetical protein
LFLSGKKFKSVFTGVEHEYDLIDTFHSDVKMQLQDHNGSFGAETINYLYSGDRIEAALFNEFTMTTLPPDPFYYIFCGNQKIKVPNHIRKLGDNKPSSILMARDTVRSFMPDVPVMLFDTGASTHAFNNADLVDNLRETDRCITDYNGNTIACEFEGDKGLLKDVLISESAPRNIISGTLLMKMGLHFYTEGDYLFIADRNNTLVSMGKRARDNLIYMCDSRLIRLKHTDELIMVAKDNIIDNTTKGSCPNRLKKYGAGMNILNILHNRFGHLPEKKLKAIIKNGKIKGLGMNFEDVQHLHLDVCDACIRAKMRRLPAKPSASGNNEERLPFEKVGSDVVGKVQVKSIHGNNYFVFYVDYKTNYMVTYFIQKKSELLSTLEELESKYIKFYGHKMKILQSDSEAIYKDIKVKEWCSERNIQAHFSAPHFHQANGKAERNIQTVLDMSRTFMLAAGAPDNVWEYTVALAVHNLNMTPRSNLDWKSPHEVVTGETPDVSHLIPFYAKGWAYKYQDEKDGRTFKFGERASNVYFLGFPKSSRNTFIVKTSNGKIMVRRDCQFDEHLPLYSADHDTTLDEHIDNDGLQDKSEHNQLNKEQEESLMWKNESAISEVENEENDPTPIGINIRPQRIRKKPERYGSFVNAVIDTPAHDIPTPMNCKQALHESNKYRDHWMKAICDEMEEMYSRQSLVAVDMKEVRNAGRKPFRSKFVFKVKVEPDGSIKFKARLVGCGYSQIKGLDYDLTYSPTPNFFIVILLIHIATTEGYYMEAVDIANAYQEAKADKLMYMMLPKDYTEGNECPVRLDGNINGTKQGALLWFILLERVMMDFGFMPSAIEPCLFIKNTGDDIMFCVVYVDDILMVSKKQQSIVDLQNHFKQHFKRITIQKQVKKFLGIQIFHQYREDGSRYTTLSQPDYITEKFSRYAQKTRDTPLPVNLDSIKEKGEPVQLNMMDKVGCIRFPADRTRPDIAFAASFIARFANSPTKAQVQAAVRVAEYLQSTKDIGINVGSRDRNITLHAYADAAFATEEDSKSQLSYQFYLSEDSGCILWRSMKDKSVSLSSTQSEIHALVECIKTIIWYRELLKELGYEQVNPTTVYQDNVNVISLSELGGSDKNTKYLINKINFIREAVKENIIFLIYKETAQMRADIGTKQNERVQYLTLRDLTMNGSNIL